jgi:hypothetical protein
MVLTTIWRILMPRLCPVCESLDRRKIEKELLEIGTIKGKTFMDLSRKTKINERSLSGHKRNHMSKALAKEVASRMPHMKVAKICNKKSIPALKNLADCFLYLHEQSLDVHDKAMKLEDQKAGLQIRLQAIRTDASCLELAIRGKELWMAEKAQGSWDKLLPVILKVVEPYPEVRLNISKAIREIRVKESVTKGLNETNLK